MPCGASTSNLEVSVSSGIAVPQVVDLIAEGVSRDDAMMRD